MASDEELAVFAQRVTYVTGEIEAARRECEWSHLADITGADPQPFADRAYGRLEAMSTRDLALAVVLLFNDDARRQAMRSWSQLRTVEAEDAR